MLLYHMLKIAVKKYAFIQGVICWDNLDNSKNDLDYLP